MQVGPDVLVVAPDTEIEAVIAVAGIPCKNGIVFTPEALRSMASGGMVYDEDRKSLIWKGKHGNLC